MRIVLTLLVRDEIDIIASNLEYHFAEGVDHIIVTDNGSQDGTTELLSRYQSRGRLTLLHESPSDFSQHRWVTRMARMAHDEFGADWVVNADADEAFVSRKGTVREALQRVPADVGVISVGRTDFVPFECPGRQSPLVEMVYRKAVSLNLAGRALPPKVVHRGVPDVVVTQGNHEARSNHFQVPAVPGELTIFHYPVRTLAQFKSKVRNGGSGYANNKELAPGQGFHKRQWYEQLCSGQLDREYSQRMFFDAGRLHAALAAGELLVDRTLCERIGRLPAFSAGVAPTGP